MNGKNSSKLSTMQSKVIIIRSERYHLFCLNSLTNDNILDWSKLKAFADDKINVNQKLKFASGQVENIVTSIFSFHHNVYKGLFIWVVQGPDCMVRD